MENITKQYGFCMKNIVSHSNNIGYHIEGVYKVRISFFRSYLVILPKTTTHTTTTLRKNCGS